jgi:endonuclease/exonuclease/phosphatase family metal-dependent hydrolase
MKVVNWNVEWASPAARRGRLIREELCRAGADVICLTEAFRDLLPPGGDALESERDYGYGSQPSRRKVILWSRHGFTALRASSPPGMPPGRFVQGVVNGSGVVVIGVCIPWSRAHVTTGRRDCAPWQEHITYLAALGAHLDTLQGQQALVVGDFNQTVPRTRAPQRAYESLLCAFGSFPILTASRAAPGSLIDHIAATPGTELEGLAYLPQLSDHVGWSARVHIAPGDGAA